MQRSWRIQQWMVDTGNKIDKKEENKSYQEKKNYRFLDASSYIYERVCLSVRPSVCIHVHESMSVSKSVCFKRTWLKRLSLSLCFTSTFEHRIPNLVLLWTLGDPAHRWGTREEKPVLCVEPLDKYISGRKTSLTQRVRREPKKEMPKRFASWAP